MHLTGVLAVTVAAAALGLGGGVAAADTSTPPAPAQGDYLGDYAAPPGHHAGLDGVVPMWAPPPPRPPVWAPWIPVVWNSDLTAWGVWWNGAFIRM